jgi:hypothetical protein
VFVSRAVRLVRFVYLVCMSEYDGVCMVYLLSAKTRGDFSGGLSLECGSL